VKEKHFWIIVISIIAIIICWGLRVMFKPNLAAQPAESLQRILFDHIKNFPEVYQAHENYSQQLKNDTCSVLIYRYSSNMCSCYQDDLMDLYEFIESIGIDKALILPAYPFNDSRSRIRINSETKGLKYQNIPSDSLALPIREDGEEKRYFAIIDAQGKLGMVFFPVTGRQDLTRRYFQEVKRFFQ